MEEAPGEPGRAPAPEPVRFGWVKGVMVSATHPTGSILLPSHPPPSRGTMHLPLIVTFFPIFIYIFRKRLHSERCPCPPGRVGFLSEEPESRRGAGRPQVAPTLRAGPPLCPPQIRCMLNIWGVILYLRLPWITAQAGIGGCCGVSRAGRPHRAHRRPKHLGGRWWQCRERGVMCRVLVGLLGAAWGVSVGLRGMQE